MYSAGKEGRGRAQNIDVYGVLATKIVSGNNQC
jgi:hypothetical protein